MDSLNRRSFLSLAAAGLGASLLPRFMFAQTQPARPTWLLFTKSAGFEHDPIKRRDGNETFLHQHLAPVFAERGIELIESKDGGQFHPDKIGRYAGFVFYTTGDLQTGGTDGQPPMSRAGHDALLAMIATGTPFIGLHCASDTFLTPPGGTPGEFVKMLGGEFESHGDQQRATARIVAPDFPGIGTQADWTIHEEWYAIVNLAPDVRPIHLLETAGMKGDMYRRDPFPITWTREHGKGRVFYTAIGHREDVIASAAYKRLIGGAIEWMRRQGG